MRAMTRQAALALTLLVTGGCSNPAKALQKALKRHQEAPPPPAATTVPADIAVVVPRPLGTPIPSTLVVMSIAGKDDGTEMAWDLAEVARATGLFREVIVGEDTRLGDLAVSGEWSVKHWTEGSSPENRKQVGVIATRYEIRTSLSLRFRTRKGKVIEEYEVKDVPSIVSARSAGRYSDLLEPVYRDLRQHYVKALQKLAARATGQPAVETPPSMPPLVIRTPVPTPTPAVAEAPDPAPGPSPTAGPVSPPPTPEASPATTVTPIATPTAAAVADATPPPTPVRSATPTATPVGAMVSPTPAPSTPEPRPPALPPVSGDDTPVGSGIYLAYLGGPAFGLKPEREGASDEDGEDVGSTDALLLAYRRPAWMVGAQTGYSRFQKTRDASVSSPHRSALTFGLSGGWRPAPWATLILGIDGGAFEMLDPVTGDPLEASMLGGRAGFQAEMAVRESLRLGAIVQFARYTLRNDDESTDVDMGFLGIVIGYGP